MTAMFHAKYKNILPVLAAKARVPYRLVIRSAGCGFFGDVFIAMNGLRLAEVCGTHADVEWGAESLYFDGGRGANVWTWFFESGRYDFSANKPPSDRQIPFSRAAYDFPSYDGLSVRRSAHHFIDRYLRLNAECEIAVAAAIAEHLGDEPALGVHVRRTDAQSGFEGRRSINLDDYIEATAAALDREGLNRIYLASDDADVVLRFAERFGDIVSTQNCIRSTDGRSIHGHYDGGQEGSNFQKGLDVIIDAYCLARCAYLVCGHSRVTLYSLCLNPDMGFDHLERRLIDVDRSPWLD